MKGQVNSMFFKAPMTVQEHAIATCERLVFGYVNNDTCTEMPLWNIIEILKHSVTLA